MTNLHPNNIFFTIALLMLASAGTAQTSVKITADRTQILIGEPIKLMLEADIPENEAIGFFNPDSLPHFEILRRDIIDTNNTSKGTILKGAIYITSFDSGHWVIPPILLRDSIYTDSIPVNVGYTPFDNAKPYNDIKDIIEADAEKKKDAWQWWYFAISAVALAAVFYFVFRKKKKPVVQVVPEEDPFARAMRELDGLKPGQISKDLYYSTVVDIFRVYVFRRTGIQSMHQTTADLVTQLKGTGIPAELYTRLAAALQFSDLVKFARFDSSETEDEETRATVIKSIRVLEETRPVTSSQQ